MYKQKASKNITTAIIFKTVILIIGLISRRYMVNNLGNEVTGIYSLFTSILGFLAVAELGVGSAIIFSMYKPISEDDVNKTSALFYLYRKIYLVIFVIIIILGLTVTPFLPILVKDNTLGIELFITYILFLISTSITYLYAYKSSFINAHMDNYVTNSIRSIFQIIELILQIIAMIITKSFILFLVIHLISNVLQGIVTYIIFDKNYKNKINNNKLLSNDLKKEVSDKTRAMFFHKIGGLLVNTTDNLIISALIGVSILGVYSNYIVIVTSITSILSLVFSSIVTILGHAFANYSKEVLNKQFKKVYLINFLMGLVFFLGFYSISNELIMIIFNKNVLLEKNIVVILTINYFVQFMRQTVVSFKDASGTFYNDRYKPLVEGVFNLSLSLLFVNFWGLGGVLIATIITNITITHVIEPYVLYKHGFSMSPNKYFVFNYLSIILFSSLVIGFAYFPFPNFNNILITLLIKGFFSVLISILTSVLLFMFCKTFREITIELIKEIVIYLRR